MLEPFFCRVLVPLGVQKDTKTHDPPGKDIDEKTDAQVYPGDPCQDNPDTADYPDRCFF